MVTVKVRICVICAFETEPDDQMDGLSIESGKCMCLRCFARETGNEHPMTKALRLGVEEALRAAE